MYPNGRASEIACNGPGSSASGAICPAKMNAARSQKVETACTRVVQNASVARTHPEKKASAAASSTLGTNRSRCAGVVRNRASNVMETNTRMIASGTIVVSFHTRFSTTE